MPEKAVISAIDVDTSTSCRSGCTSRGSTTSSSIALKLDAKPADLSEWERTVDAAEHPKDEVTIAIVGKYVEHKDAYKSLGEALRHGGLKQHDARESALGRIRGHRAARRAELLKDVDGILVPGGFGKRGFEGKIAAVRYAREHKMPYFGICYGMHAAVIDFARNVAGLEGANSSENDRTAPHPVIALITEWTTGTGEVEKRDEACDLGGTMRLGAQECRLKAGTLARELYGQDVIRERHRHRYEFNNRYRQQFEDLGLVIAGKSMDDLLVEMVELAGPSVVRRLPVPSGVHVDAARRPSAVHRLHSRRARAEGRCAKRRGLRRKRWRDSHEALRFRSRPRQAAVPDRRTLRHRIGAAAARHGRHSCKEITGEARHPVHLQVELRQGQSHIRHRAFAAPAWTRACASSPR